MKLIEIIVAAVLVSLAFAAFSATLVPALRFSKETSVIQEEYAVNYFISKSFLALTNADSVDFEKWRMVVRDVTGCVAEVTKIGRLQNKNVYRAQWMYGGKTLYVDAVFNQTGG
jgi:hypothetical protein